MSWRNHIGEIVGFSSVGLTLYTPLHLYARTGGFGNNHINIIDKQKETNYYINSKGFYTVVKYKTADGKTKLHWLIRPTNIYENNRKIYSNI